MAKGLNTLAHTLALRLRDIARALDRLDRLEMGSGKWLAEQTVQEVEAAALQMTLRALRAAADPQNFALLEMLASRPAYAMRDLQQDVALDRLTLNERLNDMIQVGFVLREIDTDHVQITGAGNALVELFRSIQSETAQSLTEALAPVTRLD